MEGFTLSLALVDAIPVLFFGISAILIAVRFHSALFIIGASLCMLAGCCKVAWKLILGLCGKDYRWLSKAFAPLMAVGFLLMLVSFVMGFSGIDWRHVLSAMTGFPAVLFFILFVAGLAAMGIYRGSGFDDSAKANWIAQALNCAAQISLFLGILLAR